MTRLSDQTIPADGPAMPQDTVLLAAALGVAGVAGLAGWQAGPSLAAAAFLGAAAGFALYHAAFGFTGAWRRVLTDGRSAGARAQLVMLAAAGLITYPLLGWAETAGAPLYGFVNPIGVPLALGAFLFGIGMQLGGGCGSGTLFVAGGGSTRMLVTLAAFIAGSVAAVLHFPAWITWPALPGVSVIATLGWLPALALLVLALAAGHLLLLYRETARHGSAASIGGLARPSATHILRGPWTLMAGALALAGISIATLLVTGAPWGITSAFALWGSKIAALAGAEPAAWPYWASDPAIAASLFADRTSVMDFGLMLGALAAAGLASRFRPGPLPGARSLAAAVLGGLLMGCGARLSTGCNIGAFVSGTLSGSLHGPLWLLCALPGNWIGIRLRPWFGLEA